MKGVQSYFVIVFLLIGSVFVSANTIDSSTMIFEGPLTANEDGSYSGAIDAIAGSYYYTDGTGCVDGKTPDGGACNGGFDVYAKEGETAYYDDLEQGTIGSDHDAYSTAGGWGSFYSPDVADYYNYQITFSGADWYLEYKGDALGTPMSGDIDWNSMYAEELDTGSYRGTVPSDEDANDGDAASNGGGAHAWDMDWTWGSEAIPLEYEGFEVEIDDLGTGNYRVELRPAPFEAYVNAGSSCSGQPCFSTITEAIDVIAEGGTIYVESGTYTEQLVIDKAIELIGESNETTIIDGNELDNVIVIQSDDVILNKFTIKNSKKTEGQFGAVFLQGTSGVVVSECLIEDSFVGVGFVASTNALIENNTIDNNYYGVYVGTSDNPSNNNIIRNNEIKNSTAINTGSGNSGDGIYIEEGNNVDNLFEDNYIHSNQENGVYSWKGAGNEFIDNIINENGANGIHLMGSSNNVIEENVIANNTNNAFLLRCGTLSTTNNDINDNYLEGNTVAFQLEDDENEDGNSYDGFVSGNSISDNEIISHTNNVILVNTPIDQTYTFENNYWGEEVPTSSKFTDDVDYDPWYINEEMTELSCTPGTTEQRNTGTDIGECTFSVETKTCQENGLWGEWIETSTGQDPVDELLDGKDNNCNGFVDDQELFFDLETNQISITGGEPLDLSSIDTDTQLTDSEVKTIIEEENYLTSYTETDPIWDAAKTDYLTSDETYDGFFSKGDLLRVEDTTEDPMGAKLIGFDVWGEITDPQEGELSVFTALDWLKDHFDNYVKASTTESWDQDSSDDLVMDDIYDEFHTKGDLIAINDETTDAGAKLVGFNLWDEVDETEEATVFTALNWLKYNSIFEETDPVWLDEKSNYVTTQSTESWDKDSSDDLTTSHPASAVTQTKINNWETAYAWGNHESEGYLTTEEDPLFSEWDKSTGISITESQITDLNKYTQSEVDTAIETESTRAQTAESSLSDDIYSERIRAETVENQTISDLETESTRAQTVEESLESRSVKDTRGYDIYLSQGWNQFRLPYFVLTGNGYVNGLDLQENYTVENVLADIEFDYLAYFDGDEWKTYVQNNETENTFKEFPVNATKQDYVYYIYVNQGARLSLDIISED